MSKSTNQRHPQKNKFQSTHSGSSNLQQNVKSFSNNTIKGQEAKNSDSIKTNVNTNGEDQDKHVEKSKATYSAQYEAPHIRPQQNFNSNASAPYFPNAAGVGYDTYYNGMPLNNTSYNGQNISMQNGQQQNFNPNASPPYFPNAEAGNYRYYNDIPFNNTSYNRQNIPMPGNDMQYSCPCGKLTPPMPPCKDDLWDLQFCRWWGWNWIRKREEMLNQKKTEVVTRHRTEDKPKCTMPEVVNHDDRSRRPCRRHHFFSWCNKLFKGRNKRKQDLGDGEKHQLQELYNTPCASVTFNQCPCPIDDWECRSLDLKGQYECYCSTTQETSRSTVVVNKTRHQRCKQNMRNHQSWIYEKTDSSSSDEFCSHICVCPKRNESTTEESVEYLSMRMEQVKADSEDNGDCCTCNKRKETKKEVCCPCKNKKRNPKEDRNICCPCMIKLVYKQPKQKLRECNCNRHLIPCSVPVSRCSPPCKVPQFRRFPLVDAECRKRPKRKYVDCQKKKAYPVGCYCEQPRKKIRTLNKPKEVDCYYCCCCCCCCNKKDENRRLRKSKSEKSLKQTADKCTGSKSMVENLNVLQYGMYSQTNDATFCKSFPVGDGMQDKVYNTRKFSVSKSIQEGLYASPLTGRLYNLNPKTFTVNQVAPQSNLPKPLDVNDKVFNINPVELPIADEEHKALLSAVCDAIMSSRFSTNQHRGQASTFPKTESSRSNNRGNTIHKRPRSCDQIFPPTDYDYFDFISDKRQTNNTVTEMDELTHKKFTVPQLHLPKVSKPFEYKILLSPNNVEKPFAGSLKCNVKSLSKQNSVSHFSEKSKYFITKGKHGPIRQKYPSNMVESQNYKIQQLCNLKTVENEQLNLQVAENITPRQNYSIKTVSTDNSLEGFSTTNIFENYNKKIPIGSYLQNYYGERSATQPNPLTTLKSCIDNSSGGSGDSFDSDDTSVLVKKHLIKNKSKTFIPFNSPRNWIKRPQLPGISMTGLFSAVGDVKEFTKIQRYKKKKSINNNKYNKSRKMKNQGLYNSIFSNEHSDYPENFSSLPYNYSPIPNPRSAARNPAIYPSLVLQELPSDIAQGTQTTTSATTSRDYSQEVKCGNEKDQCNDPIAKEIGCENLMKQYGKSIASCSKTNNTTNFKENHLRKSQTTETSSPFSSKALQTNNLKTTETSTPFSSKALQTNDLKRTETSTPFSSKALQTNDLKTTETLFIVRPKTVKVSISKPPDNTKLTQTPAVRTVKACNTIYSMGKISNSKRTSANDVGIFRNESNAIELYQTSIARDSSKSEDTTTTKTTNVAPFNLNLSNNLKSIVINTVSCSKSPTDTLKTTTTSTGLLKRPRTNHSETVDTISINSKSTEIANIKLMENTKPTKQDAENITFIKEYNSEKEIGCSYYNEDSSKELYTANVDPPYSTANSSYNSSETVIQKNSDNSCVYLNHESPRTNLFANSNVKLEQSEKLLAVVDKISKEDASNVPSPPPSIPTTSKVSSKIVNDEEIPKSFTSAASTPVYITSTTSPFKIKYGKTRLEDRIQSDNFGKENKLLKRESPFSMFCNPVQSKTIDVRPSPNKEMVETGSLSRPDRQIVVNKSKKLKMREKRWRY